MNKVELLQEKYNAKKNDMSKEELLEFNEHLFKSFLSDKEANDDVFWAYSEITDRVIEDLKENNAQPVNENILNDNYINTLEFEVKHYRRLSEIKESEIEKIRNEFDKLEKYLVRERSLSNQLSFQAESHERDIIFFQQAIKEQRGIVIDEVVKLLEKETDSYSSIFQNSEIRIIKDLKNKIKEMGNK